jgi:hypothetical protein
LLNRKDVCPSSDSMSRRIWRASSSWSGLRNLPRVRKETGAPRVVHVAPDAAVQVFLARDVGQDLGRFGVGHFGAEHVLADLFQRGIDVFQRIGRVFGVGGVEVEQHVLAVGHVARLRARAQALQTEDRQFFGPHRKQHVAMQDQRHRHVARLFLGIEQEVRVQVNLAVVLDVEAGAGLQVGQAARIGQLHVVKAADPGANLRRRRHQVDPDRLQAFQVVRRVDADLAQAAVAQLEGVTEFSRCGNGCRRSGPGALRRRGFRGSLRRAPRAPRTRRAGDPRARALR